MQSEHKAKHGSPVIFSVGRVVYLFMIIISFAG